MRRCKPYNLVIILILLAAQFYPAAASSSQESVQEPSYISTGTAAALAMVSQLSVQNQINTNLDIVGLIDVSTNKTDTDKDGLPDSVEAVLGTDFNNTDSDFDMLDDYNESVFYESDPLEPDSNHDGLSDYFEVTDVDSLDADGDGFSNVWDLDNDDDKVMDSIDLSPYSHSGINDSFLFDIRTNGNPTYVTFQIKPRNPDNLRLPLQDWDWPYDDKGQMKDLDDSTDDIKIIPMLELRSNVIPDQADLLEYGIVVSSDSLYIPLTLIKDYGTNVAFGGRMFYPASDPSDISINASLVWLLQGKTDKMTAGGIESETVTLAKYKEGCMLTGFEVEENYGTDVGMFYGDSVNQTLLAGFLMAFSYLRDNQTTLYDMPAALMDSNLTINSEIGSVSHRDMAVFNTTSEMKEHALKSLPGNKILPLLAAYQFNFTSKGIDDLVSGDVCVNGNEFDFDLTASPSPAVTMKTIKMSWYDTTTKESVGVESFLPEVESWGQANGLDEDAINSMMSMALLWNFGESVVTRLNGAYTSFHNAMDVKAKIKADGFSYLTPTIKLAIFGVYLFTSIKLVGFGKALWGAIKVTIGASVKAAAQAATKTINALKVAGKVVTFAALALEAAFAVVGFIIFLDSGSTLQATVYITAMTIYLVILAVLLLAGPIGEVIAAIIMVADAIASIFGHGVADLIGKLVALFMETHIATTVDMQILKNSINIRDYDDNGLDVGDHVEFQSLVNSTVTKTEYGDWYRHVEKSYVIPSYTLLWKNSYFASYDEFTDVVSYDPKYPDSTNTTYDARAWLEPVRPTINFGQGAIFKVDYKYYYIEEKIEWDMRWHTYDREKTGSQSLKIPTVYFDVLPENIEDFKDWAHMVYKICILGNEDWCFTLDMPPNPYPLDSDGDGLNDSEETVTDMMKWDTDGDGLSDKYELDIETDPNNWDIDQDGLNDKMELFYGTNTSSWDTDGDGLSDYMEQTGWAITFNFDGKTINIPVRSNPLLNDTDGDGLDDQMEYYSNLNPRSKDTDGDGNNDVANPKLVTAMEFVTKWGSQGTGNGEFDHCRDAGVDQTGNVYVLDRNRVQKFDPNGTFIKSWTIPYYGYGIADDIYNVVAVAMADPYGGYNGVFVYDLNGNYLSKTASFATPIYDVASDKNGYLYLTDAVNHLVKKYYANCVYTGIQWGGQGTGNGKFNYPSGIATDSNGYVYVADLGNDRIQKFSNNGLFIRSIPGYPPWTFSSPYGMSADSEGNIFVSDRDNHRILGFDTNGLFLVTWGSQGSFDGQFEGPWGIGVSPDGSVYVADETNNVIQKFNETLVYYPPDIFDPDSDTDGDGLKNIDEMTGWNVVSFVNSTGVFYVSVTSEPLINDTDYDGLTDYQEFNFYTNPRDVDTDDDGLTDYVEWVLGTNIKGYDSEGDGLDDNLEMIFGTDPWLNDTDGDGLSDYYEYLNYSNPRDRDTDGDGLSDSEELAFNSSMLSPDSDGDMLSDGEEYNQGSDPRNPDTDGDGLDDGNESLYNTSLLLNDTDGDGVGDKEEIENWMDPLNNDTDGDGLDDYSELQNGTNPVFGDTRGNGINDSEDPYSLAPNVDDIWMTCDPDEDSGNFIENLNKYTNVTVFQPEELANYSTKPYILIVGRPGLENSTAGNITHSILNSLAPDELAKMQESDFDRFYTTYDIWTSPQTVVMLSNPYVFDHYAVLDSFKTLNQTIEYQTPVSSITVDAVKEMDAFVWIELEKPVKPTVRLGAHNSTDFPHVLAQVNEKDVGKSLDINVSENILNATADNIDWAKIVIYYTAKDLDRTGDGYSNDLGDINEKSIGISWFNELSGEWEKLSTDMDWVNDVGVNTTNDVIYGKEYEGYAWANVSHLSLYGLSGSEIKEPVVPPHDGHRRIPIITDEESQDENITVEDVQAPLESPENTSKETPAAAETDTLPETQSIWFYLAVAMIILLTGLGAAYVLKKKM
ncbi:hypothetical protein MSMTP_2126 [Methanosarcina sp. MTP4]|uniref:hypothetical protein n=1 Tax=Methanosarcina sp. MTP4 TaxID=1434100 RepID=UPI0006155DC9|nr:hypothetical protein [Methanosarcina sp. MTP4]AKB25595.1 hypothetical protein MSMTP_2126 [Methanosarcina sp. MTP4]